MPRNAYSNAYLFYNVYGETRKITVNEVPVVTPPEEWPLEPCEKEFDISSDEERECTLSPARNTTNHEKDFPQRSREKVPPVVSLQTSDGSVIHYGQMSEHKKQNPRPPDDSQGFCLWRRLWER